MHDCCVIGGGVVGLSIARELAGRGMRVRVVARDPENKTSSWAAAGILPPAPHCADARPGDRLTAWSDELHREWARELREETGIDTGLTACGGLYVAVDGDGPSRLADEARAWRAKGARCEWLELRDIVAIEPGLRSAADTAALTAAYLLPDEQQIRPPRHLEALRQSCRLRGVELSSGCTAADVELHGDRASGIVIDHACGGRETIRAAAVVVAAGAWSERLVKPLGLALETRPIRGQIALYRFPRPPLNRIVNLGLEYLVPRSDGRLLVGSTLEEAGFDTSTTSSALARLADVAGMLLGDISAAECERAWAGLRPGSVDRLPTVGRVPGIENAFIATGHFRAGLHQSTGTAVLLADLLTGCTPPLDPTAFAPDRALLTPR